MSGHPTPASSPSPSNPSRQLHSNEPSVLVQFPPDLAQELVPTVHSSMSIHKGPSGSNPRSHSQVSRKPPS
eukprot:1438686-Rhodomonas_salina.1